MASSSPYTHLIVGSGVFGASTAYHLSKSEPHSSSRIALIDRSPTFPAPVAASHDFNKVVRADYGNAFYSKLALEAMSSWTTDPLYVPYFHKSGMLVLDDTGLGKKIVKNYDNLQAMPQAKVVGVEELKNWYGGLYADADLKGVEEVFINTESGWAEATKAVTKVHEVAKENGVRYLEGDVQKLLFGDNGRCVGVQTKDGRVYNAEKVIICTGAGTAKLLANSAPDQPLLQSGDRITAAAVVTSVVQLSSEQMKRFGKAPVFVHSVGKVLGEVLAPTPKGILKFCVDVSFKNTTFHESSGQMISAPPDSDDYAQHEISQKMQDECTRVVKGIYGRELEGFEFNSFRICWDGITPNQDFIISPHSHCQNLYVATGGSFHGWKFLPILGKYVVQMLDETLEKDKSERWAWDREQKGSAHETVMPRRELADIL